MKILKIVVMHLSTVPLLFLLDLISDVLSNTPTNCAQFTSESNSYATVDDVGDIRTGHDIELEFRTTVNDGILWYSWRLDDTKPDDFFGLFISSGRLTYSFNAGSGIGTHTTSET